MTTDTLNILKRYNIQFSYIDVLKDEVIKL